MCKSAASATREKKRPAEARAAADGGGARKKPKRSFVQGLRDRIMAVAGLCRTLVSEPREFPGELKRVLLQWTRDTWQAQGGGFYACGFVLTFAFLEIKLLFVDLFGSAGAGDFVVEQVMQLLFRFTVDSLVNTVHALIWPAWVLSWSPLWGLLALVAGYFLFNRLLKEPLTAWLFHEH